MGSERVNITTALARVALNSKLALGAGLGQTFRIQEDSRASKSKFVQNFPWQLFFQKGSPIPDIRVRMHGDGMNGKVAITREIRESFSSFSGDPSADASSVSRISYQTDERNAYINIDAGGSFINAHEFSPFSKVSRLNVPEVAVAAAVEKCVLPRLVDMKMNVQSKINIWDPFCGSGVIPIVLSRILSGIPAGSPAIPYPFLIFPCHASDAFERLVGDMQIIPHPMSDFTTVTATDSAVDAIAVAKSNWEKFSSMLPRTSGGDVIRYNVAFDRVFDIYSPPVGYGKVFVVTALPAGGDVTDTRRKYKRFQSMLQSLLREGRLLGCVVFTNKSRMLRSISDEQRWVIRERYFDVRGDVEVLELVS